MRGFARGFGKTFKGEKIGEAVLAGAEEKKEYLAAGKSLSQTIDELSLIADPQYKEAITSAGTSTLRGLNEGVIDPEDAEKIFRTKLSTAVEVGVTKEKLTSSQRIDKSNAIQILESGGVGGEQFENRVEAEAYIMDNLKVDIADPDIQEVLSKYKLKKVKKGFFKKYPERTKYGYTYEKREDGKWHRKD